MPLEYSCFISYRRNERDGTYITNLKKILQSEMHTVTNKNRAFIDNDAIRYGEHFDQAIYHGIENSFFFIPVWYFNYLHKDNLWCAKELFHALEIENKVKELLPIEASLNFFYIIPLLFRGDVRDMPTCLSNKLIIDLKLMESDILRNISSNRLTNFRQKLYDALLGYYKIFKKHIDEAKLKEIYEQIEKPDDEKLRQWVQDQHDEMRIKESKKLPLLKKTYE